MHLGFTFLHGGIPARRSNFPRVRLLAQGSSTGEVEHIPGSTSRTGNAPREVEHTPGSTSRTRELHPEVELPPGLPSRTRELSPGGRTFPGFDFSHEGALPGRSNTPRVRPLARHNPTRAVELTPSQRNCAFLYCSFILDSHFHLLQT